MGLKIIKYPNPILRKKCEKVEKITPEIKRLALDMVEIMLKNNGIGLAAPQVGISKRIIVVLPIVSRTAEEKSTKSAKIFINPEITKKSKDLETAEEGCLCFPEDFFVKVKRAKGIEFTALDEEGNKVKISAEGLPARIFQHESEHLDGIMIIDKMGKLQKFKSRFSKK